MSHNNNPYTKAADAYGATAAETDQRSMEGRILLKAAQQLEDLQKRLRAGETVSREEIGDVMNYNQKLWLLFVDDMKNPDHPVPQEIKNNIVSLALFIFKRTLEVLANTKPESLQALININRNIASGLMKKPSQPAAQQQASALPSVEAAATDSLA